MYLPHHFAVNQSDKWIHLRITWIAGADPTHLFLFGCRGSLQDSPVNANVKLHFSAEEFRDSPPQEPRSPHSFEKLVTCVLNSH